MDTKFNQALTFVLKHEGGYTTNVNDPGGVTNFGISTRLLKSIGSNRNVKSIDLPEATLIYEQYFWKPNKYDRIDDVDIAAKIFDMTVNMGEETAHKLVQKAINIREPDSVVIDGILGDKSFAAINELSKDNENDFMNDLCYESVMYYKSLVEKKQELNIFIDGWKKRGWDAPNLKNAPVK